MIPSRFCGCCCSVDGFVSEDPFVSAVDIVALCGDSIWSVFLIIWLVAACLNSLFNWNNEKFRRLSVVNLKTFNMFQLLLNRIFVWSLTASLAHTWMHCLFHSAPILCTRFVCLFNFCYYAHANALKYIFRFLIRTTNTHDKQTHIHSLDTPCFTPNPNKISL